MSKRELTKREVEVLECVAKGMSNKEIASSLVISMSTIKTHLHHIYTILNLKNKDISGVNRVKATLYYLKEVKNEYI